MMYLMPISSKGQVTIPVSLRRQLKIQNPGDKLLVKADQGKLILEPVTGDIMDLYGILKNDHKSNKPADLNKIIAIAKRRHFAKVAKQEL